MKDEIEGPVFVAEIDGRELTIRLCEAITNTKRPEGMSPEEVLSNFDHALLEKMTLCARAAAEYIAQCIDGGTLVIDDELN